MSEGRERPNRLGEVIGLAKDLVTLTRDGGVVLIVLFAVLRPSDFSATLSRAGMSSAEVAGFKWQAAVERSNNKLESTGAVLSAFEKDSSELLEALRTAVDQSSDPELKGTFDRLEKETRDLREKATTLREEVESTVRSNKRLTREYSSVTPPTLEDYLVGVQTLGFPDEERRRLNEILETKGYLISSVSQSYDPDNKPRWFATRSTVFHYSSASKKEAERLGRLMATETGQPFAVQRGAGRGVDPSQRDITLYVHWLR